MAGAAAQPRRLAVLALVARAGERGITRSKILGYLWPDADEDRGRSTLTKALSALRHDLESEELFLPANDLRLNPSVVSCDVVEFESALAAGRLEQAAALYAGPFLDGFRLPGASEFERWAEEERAALEHNYEVLLERLAKRASASADAAGAVAWWRKLAATDALNGRYALGFMEAMVAAGDLAGALQHARVYEALVEQELDVDPDRDVVAFARRLRAERSAPSLGGGTRLAEPTGRSVVVAEAAASPSSPSLTEQQNTAAPPSSAPPAEPGRDGRIAWAAGSRVVVGLAAGALVISLGALWAAHRLPRRPPSRSSLVTDTTATPVIALGRIADYRAAGNADLARPLTDMLATNLARVRVIRVVSNARMYELASQLRIMGGPDSVGASLVSAARRAGATELVDGAIYDVGGGRLRLDLRRVDLTSGDVRQALSVLGDNPFALADSGTAGLVAAFGATGPSSSVADVTTKSLAAYRLYDDGLRAYYRNERARAATLFEAALREDSTFAMAAYYDALATRTWTFVGDNAARTMRLATRATDRERLIIRAGFAYTAFAPELAAVAETLAVRYPQEVEGHFYLGAGLVLRGDNLGAIPYFERVVAMDSLSLHGDVARCLACEALGEIVQAYERSDSLDHAERAARRWIALQPRSPDAWRALMVVLARGSHVTEAGDILRAELARGDTALGAEDLIVATLRIAGGDLDAVERVVAGRIRSGNEAARMEAYWYLAIAHRYAGRLRLALDEARRYRTSATGPVPAGAVPGSAVMEAQVLFDMGRFHESAALFDSISRWSVMYSEPSARAKFRVLSMVNAANAYAAAGDTAVLAAFADSIRAVASYSGYGRDRRLEHHVRALLLRARQRDDESVAEFRSAISSPNEGYTRTNLELGRLLLAHGHARDAIAVLRPAIHGSVEATNLYATRTELYEALAEAWNALAQRDSAATYATRVIDAWSRADPAFGPRVAEARRIAAGR